ncbi:MFS transporter [Pseudidiomarina sediminum]|uniref:MFS transporter n=1 Tax=Pseudidiomarina sediminum TaxID=431675 RepID=UPI001C94CB26|nr:MFS transporter [Pseudidiomarina sediminum]
MTQSISRLRLIGFSVGAVGTGLFSTTPTVLLLFYLTQLKGVEAGLAGLALLIPKLWDMVTDPAIGRWSDAANSKYGRRLPFMLAGTLLMPLGLIMMFSVPESATADTAFWFVLVAYLFSATAYTLFSVPYITIPAELSRDPDERLKIMSYRTAGVMLGIIAGSGLPPFLISYFGETVAAYQQTAIILAGICVVFMLISIGSIASLKLLEPVQQQRLRFVQQLRQVMTPLFSYLVVTHVLQIIAVGILLACASYLAIFVNGLSGAAAGSFLTATFATATVAMPLWRRISTATSRVMAFALGTAVYTCVAVVMLWQGTATPYGLFVGLGIGFGLGFAAIQMIPYALLTDTIHQHGANHGFGAEGIFTGIWTATEKLGLALAPFLVGVALQAGGFISGAPKQTPFAIDTILFVATLLPALLMLLSLGSLLAFQKHFARQQVAGSH